MSRAKLTIRFDIDTIVCLQSGVPALLELADKLDVRFTFFANMGRAVDFSQLVRRGADAGPHSKAERLPTRTKLGLSGLLKTVVLNPRVGLSGILMLERLVQAGHDLGLHGGRNHGSWQHGSLRWSEERVLDELRWGANALVRKGLPRPSMFASPGWTSPAALPAAMRLTGFDILADGHGENLSAEPDRRDGLTRISTGMLGEPGGVGFIENLLARRLGNSDRKRVYDSYFDQRRPWVAYDHPAIALAGGRTILEELVRHAQRREYEIIPLSEMART